MSTRFVAVVTRSIRVYDPRNSPLMKTSTGRVLGVHGMPVSLEPKYIDASVRMSAGSKSLASSAHFLLPPMPQRSIFLSRLML
jgi:hypothetical protein